MNYLLNIHTTSEIAIVNVCDGPKVLSTLFNADSKQHAAFLHTAIHQMLKDNFIKPTELKAVGVTGGPGSYTGIRVGLDSAKGLCFSLKIPMMMFNTLEVMAASAIENIDDKNALYCPMIDARRMEVFTSVYDNALNEVKPPSAIVLTENLFEGLLHGHTIYFLGSGAVKFKKLVENSPADFHFPEENISTGALAGYSWNKFKRKDFDDISGSNPLYVKEFYSTSKK